jgi:hypothetical protein
MSTPDQLAAAAGATWVSVKETVRVQAVRLARDANWGPVAEWCGGHIVQGFQGEWETALAVPDADGGGKQLAFENDWVVRGSTGAFYVRYFTTPLGGTS